MKNTGPVVSVSARSASKSLLKKGLGAVIILVAASVLPSVRAATLYWDGDANGANNSATAGTGLGTAGSWNNSLSGTPLVNWWPGSGTTDQSWVNASNNTAAFWGTVGTVSLTDNITAGGLLFNTTGYTISTGANTLTLATGSTITLNNIAAATITGAVAGSGTVTITRATTGATTGSAIGTLNLNGTSTGGWSGATTISNGATVALAGSNQALLNTSSIALGGGITLTNTSLAEAGLNRISNTAAIASTGGTFTVTNTVAAATPYSETIGAVTLSSGRLNVVTTNANTGGTQVLTLANLTQSGSGTVAFGAGDGLNTDTNQVVVTGKAQTTVGQIIGPWATVGISAASQTDYAVYDGTSHVVAANIAASAETTWTAATDSYTLSGGTTLTGARTITALRATDGAQTLALGGFNLETNGILNGGSGTLTISGTGVIRQKGTSAGNLYVNAGSSNIAISSIIANNTGALTLVKTGTGTLNLTGANSYTGDTIVQEGTLINGNTVRIRGNVFVGSLGGGQAATFGVIGTSTLFNDVPNPYSGTSSVTVYSNGTANLSGNGYGYVNNLNVIGGTVNLGGSYYMSGTLNMTGGTVTGNSINGSFKMIVTNASASTATLASSLYSAPYAPFTFTVADGAAAIDLNVTGTINPYDAQGITKAGAGVMALGAAGGGNFSGATTVSAGTLLLRNSLALQNSPLANGGTGIVFDSSVVANAFTFGGLNGSGNLALQNNAGTPGAIALTLKTATATTRSYSGVISGAGSIIKSGAGTQALSGASTYTGVTTVSAGTLKAGVASVANTSGAFGKNSAVTLANDATAIVDLNGFNTQIGSLAGGGVTGGNVTLGAATLTTGGDNTNTSYAGVISGTGGLAKIGTGIQTLTGLNTYTGGTTVSSGKLVFGNSFTMSGANAVSVAATGTAGVNYATVSNTAGTLTFGGTLGINITASLSGGESFTLFSATGGALAGDFGSTAGNVSVTGSYIASLTNNGSGIWTGTDTNGSGLNFTFSASGVNAGILLVSAIPEPSTYAAIFGAVALVGVVYRRRRSMRG
ncbi:MAG: autotransporter-associated beta strand repeat-containing protein [Opitutaceae bacterium]|jgi:autotransporter-associated beta strand protein